MNPLRAWNKPAALLEQAVGLAALGGVWYWWLGIAESNTGRLVLSLAVLILLLAGTWLLVRRGRARLAADAGESSPVVAVLLLAMSFAAAYWLIWWIPEIAGLRAQMASVAVRFGAAFALVVTFWANLLGTLRRA